MSLLKEILSELKYTQHNLHKTNLQVSWLQSHPINIAQNYFGFGGKKLTKKSKIKKNAGMEKHRQALRAKKMKKKEKKKVTIPANYRKK